MPNPKEMTVTQAQIEEANVLACIRWFVGAHRAAMSFGKKHCAAQHRRDAQRWIKTLRTMRAA